MFDSGNINLILSNAAIKSSAVLKSYFNQTLAIEYKSSTHDLVTKADIESQQIILETIKESLLEAGVAESEIGFIGEEKKLYQKGKYLLVIDPIDGSTNFACGIDYFVISIGCFIDGERQFGVLYEPMKDILYSVEKGKGAFKESQGKKTKLQIIPTEIEQSLLVSFIHANSEIRTRELKFISNIYPDIRGVRVTGAGALDLAKFADNIFQICMYGKSNIWDIAAASLLIEEAGGFIGDLEGKALQFDLENPKKIYPLIACHRNNLGKILEYTP